MGIGGDSVDNGAGRGVADVDAAVFAARLDTI